MTLALGMFAIGAACGTTSSTSPVAGSVPGSGPTTPTVRTYVGKVEGTDAYVAVLADGADEVVVYLCDGEQVVRYLGGAIEGGALWAGDGRGTTAEAATAEMTVRGSITLADGSTHGFAADRATGDAGFWWKDDPIPGGASAGGWIRLADGTWRGRSDDLVIRGSKIDGSPGSSGGAPATSTRPPGTVVIDGCAFSLKGSKDQVIRGTKIADGPPPGDVIVSGTKINEKPPAEATRVSSVEEIRCSSLFKPDRSLALNGGKAREN